jgi:predicted CopG family antitoxin
VPWRGRIIARESIYAIISIVVMVFMTTISVTEDVKEKLLKVASELQIKLGRRVDLNEALRFLVDKQKNLQLLEEACKPMTGAKETLDELQKERKLDESRLERKIGTRHKRTD